MIDAGMDGCRLNMSHCSYELGFRIVENVRRAATERTRPIAIGADLKGPKLRIGEVVGGSVFLETGARVRLTSEPRMSTVQTVSVDYPYLAEDVEPGRSILLNDGFIALRVEEVGGGNVICRVEKGGELSSRKGVNLPGVPLRVPSLTEKDLRDLRFAGETGVDFLYLSYARSGEHMREVRSAVRELGLDLPLVAKIERHEGVSHLAEIIEEADGICIARGDLGIEVPIGTVPAIQREASRSCRRAGKFVMVGGQVLASMASNPLPLRAEVSDLATAVRDGLDAIVLSDETAIGNYPVEAVKLAAHVFSEAERYDRERFDSASLGAGPHDSARRSMVVVSRTGKMVEQLASTRGFFPLIAAVASAQMANWLSNWWGVIAVQVDDVSDSKAAGSKAVEFARESHPEVGSLDDIQAVVDEA